MTSDILVHIHHDPIPISVYLQYSFVLQALELGENDPDRLRARQKQIDIGMNTEGFKALMKLGLSGRGLQVCFFS